MYYSANPQKKSSNIIRIFLTCLLCSNICNTIETWGEKITGELGWTQYCRRKRLDHTDSKIFNKNFKKIQWRVCKLEYIRKKEGQNHRVWVGVFNLKKNMSMVTLNHWNFLETKKSWFTGKKILKWGMFSLILQIMQIISLPFRRNSKIHHRIQKVWSNQEVGVQEKRRNDWCFDLMCICIQKKSAASQQALHFQMRGETEWVKWGNHFKL